MWHTTAVDFVVFLVFQVVARNQKVSMNMLVVILLLGHGGLFISVTYDSNASNILFVRFKPHNGELLCRVLSVTKVIIVNHNVQIRVKDAVYRARNGFNPKLYLLMYFIVLGSSCNPVAPCGEQQNKKSSSCSCEHERDDSGTCNIQTYNKNVLRLTV